MKVELDLVKVINVPLELKVVRIGLMILGPGEVFFAPDCETAVP